LQPGQKIEIVGINGGKQVHHKFNVMGIRIGSILTFKTVQPLEGPYTIELGSSTLSIGRGMFDKLEYKLI
jgi:Fe2+ transport system protein FeoA